MKERKFIKYCESGDLVNAKSLYYHHEHDTDGKIDIYYQDEYIFKIVCAYGHLDIAKWLYKISLIHNKPFDIHKKNDSIFRSCIKNEHYDICKWLYDISISNNESMENCMVECSHIYNFPMNDVPFTKDEIHDLVDTITDHKKIHLLYLDMNVCDNIIKVKFIEKLDFKYEEIVASIVRKYVIEKESKVKVMQFPLSIYHFKESEYTAVFTMIYPYSTHTQIKRIWFIGGLSDDECDKSYHIKIYNVTENKVIAEQKFTNCHEDIMKFTSIHNSPKINSIIEMHIKTNSKINIKNLYIYTISA